MARTKATDKPANDDPHVVRGKRKANGDSENAMQERRVVRRTPLSEQPAREVLGFEAIDLASLRSSRYTFVTLNPNSFRLSWCPVEFDGRYSEGLENTDCTHGRSLHHCKECGYWLYHYGSGRLRTAQDEATRARFDNWKFERAVTLLRSLAFGDCTWTQEDKNVFLKSVLTLFEWTTTNKCNVARRLRDAVFNFLSKDQILALLNQLLRVHNGNGDRFDPTFDNMRRYWFMDYRSIRAMSVDHLEQIKKLLFDGSVRDMLSVAYHNKDETVQFHNKIETIKYIIEDADKKTFFFGFLADPSFGVSFELVKKMMFMDHHTPATLDFLAISISALIDTGGVLSDAVHEWLFRNIYTAYLDDHTRIALLNRVYKFHKPPSECWTVLLFGIRNMAHELLDPDDDDLPMVDNGDSIRETPFCQDCVQLTRGTEGLVPVSCSCHKNLKLHVVDFLLKKRVEIPVSFWHHVAYFNLWHLAHYLHTNKPGDIELSGLYDASVIDRMIRYNSTGLAKFMMQYLRLDLDHELLDLQSMTPDMEKILVPDAPEKRRSHLKECQAFLDENKDEMPENVYLQMCNLFKQSFNNLDA